MDWHKLQHTLYDLEPSDPAEDLAKLKAQAASPAGEIADTVDYLKESVDVPVGSMPLGIDSVSDFAALAGVQINETQKDGDYARGNAAWPEAKPGRTDHPLKDKLVGEEDGIAAQFKQGMDNYNSPNALRKSSSAAKKTRPERMMGGSETMMAKLLGMGTEFTTAFRKAKSGRKLTANENAVLATAFLKTLKAEPEVLQRLSSEFRKVQAEPVESIKRTNSIKEELLRKLNAKK